MTYKTHCIPLNFTPCRLRRPAVSGRYLCYFASGHISLIDYNKTFDRFNVQCGMEEGTYVEDWVLWPVAWADSSSVDKTLARYKEDSFDVKW